MICIVRNGKWGVNIFDAYSYGILLVEMFTGKRPTDSMLSHNLTLHNFGKMALPEQVTTVIDPKLFLWREMGESSSGLRNAQSRSSLNHQAEYLVKILQIGISGSQEQSVDRMSIKNVVTQFQVIKKNNFF